MSSAWSGRFCSSHQVASRSKWDRLHLAPARVVLLDRLDQPVVGQLVPRRAPTALRPHQVRVGQHPNRALAEGAVLPWAVEHLAPDSLRGDQLGLEPISQRPLADAGLRCCCGDTVGVVAGQRLVDVADRLDVFDLDRAGVLVQLVPDLPAGHLELDRLHRRPQFLGDAVGPLDPDAPQVVDQLFRGRAFEVGAAVGRRQDHRVQGLVDTEQVEPVPVREPGRHEPGVRIELGQEVLADREQRPQVPVAQGDADVGEELLLRRRGRWDRR